MNVFEGHWSKPTITVPDPNSTLGKLIAEDRKIVSSAHSALQTLCSQHPPKSLDISSSEIKTSIASLTYISDQFLSAPRLSREKLARAVENRWPSIFPWIEFLSNHIILTDKAFSKAAEERRELLLSMIPVIFLYPFFNSAGVLATRCRAFLLRYPTAFSLICRIWVKTMSISLSSAKTAALLMDLYIECLNRLSGEEAHSFYTTLEPYSEYICTPCLSSIICEICNLKARSDVDMVKLVVPLKFVHRASILSFRIESTFLNHCVTRWVSRCMKAIASLSPQSPLMRDEKEKLCICFSQCMAYLGHLSKNVRRLRPLKQILRGGFLYSMSKAAGSKLLDGMQASVLEDFSRNANGILEMMTGALLYHDVLRVFSKAYAQVRGEDQDMPPFLKQGWENMLYSARKTVAERTKFRINSSVLCSNVSCPLEDRRSSAQLLCSGCRNVAYCSVECQQSDWTKHRSVCREIKRQYYDHNDNVMIPPSAIDKSFFGAFTETIFREHSREFRGWWKDAKSKLTLKKPIAPSDQILKSRIIMVDFQYFPAHFGVELLGNIVIEEPERQSEEFMRVWNSMVEACRTKPEGQVKIMASFPPKGSGFIAFSTKDIIWE